MKKLFSLLAFYLGTVIGNPSGALTMFTMPVGRKFSAPASSTTATVAAGGTIAANADSSIVTVTGLTAAAGAVESATITITGLTTADNVQVNLSSYTGTLTVDGEPMVLYFQKSAGQIVVHIANIHGANALNGNVTLDILVTKPIV